MARPRVEALRKIRGEWRAGHSEIAAHRKLEEEFITKMRELRKVESEITAIQAKADVIELAIDAAGKAIHDAYEIEDVPADPGPPVEDGSP